jgi:hypothetical protein
MRQKKVRDSNCKNKRDTLILLPRTQFREVVIQQIFVKVIEILTVTYLKNIESFHIIAMDLTVTNLNLLLRAESCRI